MSASRTRIEIVNGAGFHLRAAQRFVQIARRFQSNVTVARDGTSADGKSILDLLILAAAQGACLDIGADGPDAEAAIAVLSALVESGFDVADADAACGREADTYRRGPRGDGHRPVTGVSIASEAIAGDQRRVTTSALDGGSAT